MAFVRNLLALIGLLTRNDVGKRSIVRISRAELFSVLRNKALFMFLALIVLIAVGRVAMWNFYSGYLRDIGADNQLIGVAFSVQAEPAAAPPLSLIACLYSVKPAWGCGCCVFVTVHSLSTSVSITPEQAPG